MYGKSNKNQSDYGQTYWPTLVVLCLCFHPPPTIHGHLITYFTHAPSQDTALPFIRHWKYYIHRYILFQIQSTKKNVFFSPYFFKPSDKDTEYSPHLLDIPLIGVLDIYMICSDGRSCTSWHFRFYFARLDLRILPRKNIVISDSLKLQTA